MSCGELRVATSFLFCLALLLILYLAGDDCVLLEDTTAPEAAAASLLLQPFPEFVGSGEDGVLLAAAAAVAPADLRSVSGEAADAAGDSAAAAAMAAVTAAT